MRFVRLGAAASLVVAASLVAQPAPAHADATRDKQWHLGFLKVAEAHTHSQGEGVTVAVIDTGVNAQHIDLRGNVLPGKEVTPGAKTGNGQQDDDGHGTGMAGLIAAHGHGSGAGALGIAPKAKILPIRDTDAYGFGTAAGMVAGINWATDHGAKVISVSSGGGTSPELEAAVVRAQQADVVVVAAAGNTDGAVFVAGLARVPGVVAVAATDQKGNRAAISVAGPEVVIAAPGVKITSTDHTGGYRTGTGTSDSTAIVAGAVALIRAKYPSLSADEVIHRITATATDKGGPGRDEQYGYGVLNLVAALTADVPPATTSTASTGPAVRGSPTPTAVAAPGAGSEDSSGNGSGLIVVTVVILVLFAAGAIAFLAIVIRRRNRTSEAST